jgi:hypothetical protein
MTQRMRTLRRGAAALAVTTAALVPAAPAFAFHHVGVPGSACGNGQWAGGNNPTARAALVDAGHTLPLPPAGVTATPTETPAMARCAAE